MLIDVLDQSIVAMKEIQELEKSYNNVQKQEKNDRTYETAVDESYNVVKAVSQGMNQLQFSVSSEIKNKMETMLKACSDAVDRGMVQEDTANYIQREVNSIKKVILQEWSTHYHQVADPKINMLQTIKGIAPEKEKVDYASNKIKFGASWEFKQDNLDKMENGLQEADHILENLGLNDEVTEFLEKVTTGKANVSDLTADVLGWLMDKNMSTKLAISFR